MEQNEKNRELFLPLIEKIDNKLQNGSVIVAIEGGSASGKTTLGNILQETYDCSVFHMDDFFLRIEQRTSERFAEVGGNVDRERFLAEVLIPLSKNKPITYRKFDCSTFSLSSPITVTPKKLTIIEGAYSMHSELEKYYDLSVFLDISPELQKKRIENRNTPKMAKQFFDKWIPLENIYFSKTEAKKRCDLSITIYE
jgi:uridine kinase